MVSSAQPAMAMLDLLGSKQSPSNKPKLSTPQDSHKVRFCLRESHCFSHPSPGVNYLGQELVVLVSPKQPATDQSRHAGCPAVPACVTPPSATFHVLSAHRVISGESSLCLAYTSSRGRQMLLCPRCVEEEAKVGEPWSHLRKPPGNFPKGQRGKQQTPRCPPDPYTSLW